MADIAAVKTGTSGTPYSWCATCQAYRHAPNDIFNWVASHNRMRHPRRWRRYLNEKWGLGR